MTEMKLTLKQEAFAKAYIETGNASEAYRRAYDAARMKPEALHVNASKLLADTKVALRVDDLRKAHATRHDISMDKLTGMALAAYEIAITEKAPSAAVSAVMAVAKLHGLITDKKDVRYTGVREIRSYSDAELWEIVREGRHQGHGGSAEEQDLRERAKSAMQADCEAVLKRKH
jgi:phage terminase small subunit